LDECKSGCGISTWITFRAFSRFLYPKRFTIGPLFFPDEVEAIRNLHISHFDANLDEGLYL
jgi:hypothetical protein